MMMIRMIIRIDCQRLLAPGLLLCGLFFVSGCGKSDPPQFHLNPVSLVELDVVKPQPQQDIATVLAAVFGTPNEPTVLPETGLDPTKIHMAAGPTQSDQQGAKKGLYRRHCAHCHGITGDGNGPTARFLNPYPRDFREGKFKAKSTQRTAKPTDEDLRRTLLNGVYGTAMPSFKLLAPDEVDALVEYVKYLSMRGELETRLTRFVAIDLGEDESLTDPGIAREIAVEDEEYGLKGIVAEWEEAGGSVIWPNPELAPKPLSERDSDALAASIAKGRKLFYGTRAACSTCHGHTASGDGTIDGYDDWNDVVHKLAGSVNSTDLTIFDQAQPEDDKEAQRLDEEREEALKSLAMREHALATSLPPRFIIPRNLRRGVFRFGNRPIDIYWRIREGINGTPMPAAALVEQISEEPASEEESASEDKAASESASPDAATPATASGEAPGKASLTESEIWNLVDYVLYGLPYEADDLQAWQEPENKRLRN